MVIDKIPYLHIDWFPISFDLTMLFILHQGLILPWKTKIRISAFAQPKHENTLFS